MPLKTLQMTAWWPPSRTTAELLSPIDLELEQGGFSVDATAVVGLRRWKTDICGWSRVRCGEQKAFFSLVTSAKDGPWMCLQSKAFDPAAFEQLLFALVEKLAPWEAVLCNSSADNLPILAQECFKGGLTGIVNCDADPAVEYRPGDPEWFHVAGVELRYISEDLLKRNAVDPHEFAQRTGRGCVPHHDGFLFDGQWHGMFNAPKRS